MNPDAYTSELQPMLLKARSVRGHKLRFRDALPADAAFILRLRTDGEKSKYLSQTVASLERQTAWLEVYGRGSGQAYFVIENAVGRPVGTVRLYDPVGHSFCWGSWIKDDGAPPSFALESALLVYHYGRSLGFTASHFDVRVDNERVCAFHERLGARRVRSTALDHHYVMDAGAIDAALQAHARFLPEGVHIEAAGD